MTSTHIYIHLSCILIFLLVNTSYAFHYSSKKPTTQQQQFTRLNRQYNLWLLQQNQSAWIPAQHCKQTNFQEIWNRCDTEKAENYVDLRKVLTSVYQTEAYLWSLSDMALLRKSEPIVVKSQYGTSIFCAIYKSGSTAWKRVIHKAGGKGPSVYLSKGGNIHKEVVLKMGDLDNEQQYTLQNDPQVIRWMVVRNPYARLYSSYNEKLVQGKEITKRKYHRYFQLDYTKGASVNFSQFVTQLFKLYKSNTTFTGAYKRSDSLSVLDRVDVHFALQTSFCGMQQGFGYDYVLKSEMIFEWYPFIINLLNLTEAVMSGWPDVDNCFLSVPNLKCNGPSLRNQVQNQFGQESISQISSVLHNRGSVDHMLQAYTYEEASMVSQIYKEDIVGLQYPTWDGKLENFKIIEKI
eukprot:TRINITY_DN2221_c0_g1_i6.p1 TRINITY_DN2221_c0_g1~~TRINITY_DN2221_c0_g1_i6.p1  ORF type:complete len:476 (-),score=19.59 TRINITY_DN2221_c0_g1_i6:712-1929(-)